MNRHHFAPVLAVMYLLAVGCGTGLNAQPPTERSVLSSAESTQASTVLSWQSSFTYAGKQYPYRMIGTSPFSNRTTTTIPTEIIPVKLIFSDGTTFDPAPVVSSLQTSPIFTNALFAAGTTQYGDAVMRSEFWKFVGPAYHVILARPTVLPTVTEHVSSANGHVVTGAGGTKSGIAASAWFLNTVEPDLIRKFGIKPITLAFFSTINTRLSEPGSTTTTYGGYHDSLHLTTSSGDGIFPTIWGAMFSANPRDVTHVGHELAEWLNDPFYPSSPNIVPSWRHPDNHSCNGSFLEVGDPVATRLFTVNGYTFEDAAFLSWFSRDLHSIGIEGRYDLLGQLKQPATSC